MTRETIRSTGDRTAVETVLLAVGAIASVLLVIVLLTTVADASAPYSPLPDAIHDAVVGVSTALVVYGAFARFALRRPAEQCRLRRPTKETLRWAAFGLLLPGGVLGLHLAVQDATRVSTVVDPELIAEYVVASVAAGVLAGVVEEIAFRGYLLTLVEERWGPRIAVVATSSVFALLHQGHAGSSTGAVLVLGTTFLAGVLLSQVTLRTGNVWNAVAVHAGWNGVLSAEIVAMAPPGSSPGPAIVAYGIERGGVLLTGGDATVGAAPLTMAALLATVSVLARLERPGGN